MIGAVRPIDAASTRELRHELLRPAQAPEELVYDGDDAWDTLHLGAFEDERLVGIATVMRAPPPGSAEEPAWRIRGMATLPEVRGRGYGGMLLERCLEHAEEHGGDLVWCTARVGAIGFYRRYGFEVEGDPFDVPGAGEHVLARRPLVAPAPRNAQEMER